MIARLLGRLVVLVVVAVAVAVDAPTPQPPKGSRHRLLRSCWHRLVGFAVRDGTVLAWCWQKRS